MFGLSDAGKEVVALSSERLRAKLVWQPGRLCTVRRSDDRSVNSAWPSLWTRASSYVGPRKAGLTDLLALNPGEKSSLKSAT
ncbi:hypothetical protein ADL00_43405 [Streptomyces sp. AS58]|uniref:hypothetical protein n=1 Tax=Streptomyces TaxID=1883 RepID=UPI0006B0058F|nr:hypothetical protein [Streptomyces sp. AS58]KOV50619.1 hypothetical protein ADL00_43405 [Streptomyces sp. AS58]